MAAPVYRFFHEGRVLRRERIFRDRTHPLEVFDDMEIVRKFRLRRQDILQLTDEVVVDIEHPNRQGALTPVLQVLLTLRFFACGTFQDVASEMIGCDQSTGSRTIHRVTLAILKQHGTWICFPAQVEADRQKRKFASMRAFPNVFACIDCTQVAVERPRKNEADFVNRKNFHSLNVQIVCNADLVIINTAVGWPGSTHDARILRESNLFEVMERPDRPVQGLILGDSGYMMREWLLTPVLNPGTAAEQRYTDAHCATRTTVERCIGVLKRRWHCLRRLRLQPERACHVILACIILHNRCRVLNLQDLEDEDVDYGAELPNQNAPEGDEARDQPVQERIR